MSDTQTIKKIAAIYVAAQAFENGFNDQCAAKHESFDKKFWSSKMCYKVAKRLTIRRSYQRPTLK